jgi:anti-sigma factor RsiW
MNCSEIAAFAPLYCTGEIDPARAAAFAAHLADCPECARDLRAQKQLDDLLRGSVLSEAASATEVGHRVRERIAAEIGGVPHVGLTVGSGPRWRIAALASVAALLLLAVAYRHLSGPRGVYADAAADHRSEVVDAHWRPWLTDPAAISALAERTGVAPSAVLTLAPPGYHLARAKRCALDGRPFLHLVYSNGAKEFSAYLRPRDGEALPGLVGEKLGALYTTDFGAEHLGCVQTSGVTAMIVTDESASAASGLAHFAANALASQPASNF